MRLSVAGGLDKSIYQQYQQAFHSGVFDVVYEMYQQQTKIMITRKYSAGGLRWLSPKLSNNFSLKS